MAKIIKENKVVCNSCNQEKDIEFYPKDHSRKYGRNLTWCNDCKKEKAKETYTRNSSRVYSSYLKYIKENAEKHKAHTAVGTAVRSGRLIKPIKCSICGNGGRIEAHHWKGYDEKYWLDVQWVCHLCHESIDL